MVDALDDPHGGLDAAEEPPPGDGGGCGSRATVAGALELKKPLVALGDCAVDIRGHLREDADTNAEVLGMRGAYEGGQVRHKQPTDRHTGQTAALPLSGKERVPQRLLCKSKNSPTCCGLRQRTLARVGVARVGSATRQARVVSGAKSTTASSSRGLSITVR